MRTNDDVHLPVEVTRLHLLHFYRDRGLVEPFRKLGYIRARQHHHIIINHVDRSVGSMV